MHSVQKDLSGLARLNPEFADELLKLPEIKSFQTPSVGLAVTNLLLVYEMAPEAMNNIFEQVKQIGLTEERKFCAPLQAILWLVQDENIKDTGTLLGKNFEHCLDTNGRFKPGLVSGQNISSLATGSLSGPGLDTIVKTILDAAWKRETVLISAPMIHEIIQRITTRAEREEYFLLLQRHSGLQVQGYIMDDFLTKKDIFDTRDWKIIQTAIHCSRWKKFFTVADRLNAPLLISYYIDKYFNFKKTPAHGIYLTFYDNSAQCTDAAYFAQYMLNRAGYKTFMRSVKWYEDPWDGLHTGAGIIREDGSYQLVSSFTGINAVSGGPYRDIAGLDEKLSGGNTIIDSRWGAYYPPRHY